MSVCHKANSSQPMSKMLPTVCCDKKSRPEDHAAEITNILEHGNDLTDDIIAAFIVKSCKHFMTVFDNQGRTALHVAAACNRYAIAEWLLISGAEVDARDKQLGQTSLHRAVIYGNLIMARLLLRYGAMFEAKDLHGKTPAHYTCQPQFIDLTLTSSEIDHRKTKEIFVWGDNRNYNLGLENKEGKPFPHFLDYFSKQNVTIRLVSISSYHCLFVGDDDELYAVGLGDFGRLGTKRETTECIPKKVFLPNRRKKETITSISVSQYHSLVLTSKHRVFATGCNKHGQLCQRNLDKAATFQAVPFGVPLTDTVEVIARKKHSLVYTRHAIYVWGRNIGQFGCDTADMLTNLGVDVVSAPMMLNSFENKIVQVVSSNVAICCLTEDSALLYTKNTMKTLKRPIAHEAIKHIAIRGGDVPTWSVEHEKPTPEPVEVLVLTVSNTLYLWSYHDQKYIRCYLNQPFYIVAIEWMSHSVHLLATDGVLYEGTMKVNFSKHNNHEDESDGFVQQSRNRRADINSFTKIEININRVPKIDRVHNIAVCDLGKSIVALQEDSRQHLKIPALPNEMISLKILMNETDEMDALHDIVFLVDGERFAAHKFIVFSRAKGLHKIVQNSDNDKLISLQYKYLTARLFTCIMKYIYTNYTLTMAEVEMIGLSFGPQSGVVVSNIETYARLRELLGLFGVAPMFDRMMVQSDTPIEPIAFDRLSHPELCDITIECGSNETIEAHRCILSSRLDYFNMMLSNNWSESTKNVIKLETVAAEYMRPIIDFLYNNDEMVIRQQQYRNSFLYHLTEVCDRFIVTRMKDICEILLIERMHARNCVDMLEFALIYNCEMLEAAAVDFICHNLGRLLDNYCLTTMQEDGWCKVAERYPQIYDLPSPLYCWNVARMNGEVPEFDILDEERVFNVVGELRIDVTIPYGVPVVKTPKQKRIEQSASERRIYEKEALNAARRISLEVPTTPTPTPTPQKSNDAVISEAKKLAQSYTSEADAWMKVSVRNDTKKKSVLAGLKSNEVLRNEPKEQEQLISLSSAVNAQNKIANGDVSLNRSQAIDNNDEADLSMYNLSLSDFAPQKLAKKMSQKERRRQLSQSDSSAAIENIVSPSATNSAWGLSPMPSPDKPTNPWKIQSTPTNDNELPQTLHNESLNNRKPKNKQRTSKSLNESFSSSASTANNSIASTSRGNDSFIEIIQDELKQKEYYHKMKNKPLHLTQMEERAIDELKSFYNVDNVFDEHIVIERKPNVTQTVNFAKWTQQ